jgi:PAS domain S-box-containing protein
MRDIKVLVAEDEAVTALNIKSMLNRLGYKVIGPVAYGEHAVDLFLANKPDILIMDISLAGEMDGIEAVAEIHAVSDVPVVYQTAHSDKETIDKVGIKGHEGYIVKPYNQYELISAVETGLFRHELKNGNETLDNIEFSPIAAIIWDKDCVVREWNKRAEDIFGFKRNDVIGENLYDLIVEDEHKDLVTTTINELIAGRDTNNLVNQNVCCDGSKIWCKWCNSSLVDKHGEFFGILSLGIEITDSISHPSN